MEQLHEAHKLTGFRTILKSSDFGHVNLVFPGRSYSTMPLKGGLSNCCMVNDRFLEDVNSKCRKIPQSGDHRGYFLVDSDRNYYVLRLDPFTVMKELPSKIKISNHDCALSLFVPEKRKEEIKDKVYSPPKYIWCSSCHKRNEDAVYYVCSKCNFFVDFDCALMEPVKCEEGELHIQHISHQHPMPLVEICFKEKVICFACQSLCIGAPTYACAKCEYFLHKRCAECPTEVRHPSHPSHNLFLDIDHEKHIGCKLCERKCCSFIFKCSQCNWNMCIDCYLLPKKISVGDQFVLHSHHDHDQDLTLSLSSTPNTDYAEFTCKLCHVSYKSSAPRYICTTTACGFVVDVECALTPSITREGDGHGHFRCFNHQHAITRVKIDVGGDENCFACDFPSERGLAYSCTTCKFFLHKACAMLPPKLHYPIRHKHSILTLLPHKESGHGSFCSSCKREGGRAFFFRCYDEKCRFRICAGCIARRSIVKYDRHPHLLYLVEKIHDTNLECNAYDDYCKLPVTSVELCSTESVMFRCVESYCGFQIHFLCGPLPPTIEYEYHIHPLILVSSVVEEDSDEYYCDVCEEEIHPKVCVYHCQECKYTAHLHCVISEVKTALRGDLRDVELKTVRLINGVENEKPDKSHFTLSKFKDIVRKLPENDQVMLWRDFGWDISTVEYQQPKTETAEDMAAHRIRRLSRFTTEYFDNFIAWLNEFYYSERLEGKFHDLLDQDVVPVGVYMLPRNLTRDLVQLLRNHGDISSNSQSTTEMKSINFCFLSQVMRSMSTTKLIEVTKDHLKEWCFFLNYAQRSGFNVEFMFDHLKDLAYAFVGLQATAERNAIGIERIQSEDILQLQNELDSLIKAKSWGEFMLKCLSMALKLRDEDHVGI